MAPQQLVPPSQCVSDAHEPALTKSGFCHLIGSACDYIRGSQLYGSSMKQDSETAQVWSTAIEESIYPSSAMVTITGAYISLSEYSLLFLDSDAATDNIFPDTCEFRDLAMNIYKFDIPIQIYTVGTSAPPLDTNSLRNMILKDNELSISIVLRKSIWDPGPWTV